MEKDPLHNPDSLGDYGLETVKMIKDRFAKGADRGVLLMRHSAREYRRDIHDLQNPLTELGRDLALRMGDMLGTDLKMRGFASTAQRCIDTADLIMHGTERDDGGGEKQNASYACDRGFRRILCSRSSSNVERFAGGRRP